MANPLGGASRLAIALIVAVALALVLGTVYICLVDVGEPMLPRPLNVLLFVALFTTIDVLFTAWQAEKARDDRAATRKLIEALRTDMDERDGRIYAALARRSSVEITAEIPRPRVVRAVAPAPAVVGLDSNVMEIGQRIIRRLADDSG